MNSSQVANRAVNDYRLGLPTVDVATFLTAWLMLVFFIPMSQTVPGFGAIGQPALLLSLVAPVWWFSSRLVPSIHSAPGPQPIRFALLLYMFFAFASFGMAAMRPLTALEITSSTRKILFLFALTGVALLVADGIDNREKLRVLLKRIVFFSGAFAALGIAQFFTGKTLTPTIPWLSGQPPNIGSRGGFIRPLSTARHYIEFAVVVAAMLPLSIHFFLYARTRRAQVAAASVCAILLLAVPISLSRSAGVSLVVALSVLAIGWSWRRRINGLLLFLLMLPVMSAALPGVLDVFVGLFDFDESSSVQSRLSRVAAVSALIRQRPWLGAGYGTWTSDEQFLLDNEVWRTTLETGYIGVSLLILLLVSACFLAIQPKGATYLSEEDRHLGFALAGAIAGLSISLVTFDALSYRILTSLLFVFIGFAGALWRLARAEVNP